MGLEQRKPFISMKILRWPASNPMGSAYMGRRLVSALLLLGTFGCQERRGAPETERPLPASTSRPACAPDSGALAPELPGRVGDFCLLQTMDVRRYGRGSGGGLGGICDELFGGACDRYRSYGMAAILVARLGDLRLPSRSVRVVVTEFEKPAGAFGFYARRLVGEGHPAQSKARPFEVAWGRAAGAEGVAFVWRGRRVAELTYESDEETPDEAARAAATVLGGLVEQIANTLGGPLDVPYEVRFLEQDPVLPLGVRLLPEGPLGLQGIGEGAESFVSDTHGSYRVVLFVRADEPSAKDTLGGIQRALAAPPLSKKTRILSARRLRSGHDPESWYFSREGRVIVGVGPDAEGDRVLADGALRARLDDLIRRVRRSPPSPL